MALKKSCSKKLPALLRGIMMNFNVGIVFIPLEQKKLFGKNENVMQ